MDLRRFITFKTVVEEGSFLRAAQKLCCTQSTVTFHIQQLSRSLPSRCLRKSAGGCVSPPPVALPHVYDLTKVMASIRQAARRDDEPGGELRVATGETLLAYKMPRVLQRFKQRAPKVRLSLQSLNCYSIRDALLADEVDLGVFTGWVTMTRSIMELGQQSLTLVASVEQAPVDFMRPRRISR